jgi:hypothetical protein
MKGEFRRGRNRRNESRCGMEKRRVWVVPLENLFVGAARASVVVVDVVVGKMCWCNLFFNVRSFLCSVLFVYIPS